MGEKTSSEKFSKEWIDLFSDPDQFLTGKGILLQKECPLPLRLALWLEYFLTAGAGSLKEIWGRLSLEEQKVLGIEILKCYLFQPLFIRLSPEEKSIKLPSPLLLKKQGKILKVERGSEPDREVWFYYPLVHHRLWPGLLTLLQGGIFSSEEVIKGLEPELIIPSSSHLETIRQRAETLSSLFRKRPDGDVPFQMMPDRQKQTERTGVFIVEDVPAQIQEDVRSSEGEKSIQRPIPGPDSSLDQPAPPKKKKKKKPAADQMDLFG